MDYYQLTRVKLIDKAEFAEEGTFFANKFPSLGNFVNKQDSNELRPRPLANAPKT